MENRDSRTLYAAFLGFALIISAIFLSGASHFFNLQGLLIVIGGTLGATLLTYSLDELSQAKGLLFKSLFDHKDEISSRIQTILLLAQTARKEGILALEPFARREKDPFFKRAIELLTDGVPEEDAR